MSELVKRLRVQHSHEECEDCWYSCATLTCNEGRKSDECDCGAAELNALHKEAADALERRDGFVSVPREPTKAMRIAGLEQWKRVTNGIVTVKAIYRAMIAAGEK